MSDDSAAGGIAVGAAPDGVDVGPWDPTERLVKQQLRLPVKLLQQVFEELLPESTDEDQNCYDDDGEFYESRLKRNRCPDLRSASLVCREWEPAASECLWTHVVIHREDKLREFMRCSHAGVNLSERAASVRILELDIEDWRDLTVEFARFVHRRPGLRALIVRHGYTAVEGATFAVIARVLSSCSNLVVLETAAPVSTPRIFEPNATGSGYEDAALDAGPGLDLDAVMRGVGRLKCLRLSAPYNGRPADVGEGTACRVGIDRDDGREAPPTWTEVDTLPNLEIVEFDQADIGILSTSLVNIRPPLRRAVLIDSCSLSLQALLHACPFTKHLKILSPASYSFKPEILAPLQDHQPLTILRFGPTEKGVFYDAWDDYRLSSEIFQRVMRAQRSSLKLLDIEEDIPIDEDLLAWIGASAPLPA
ncbi:hypothetical protein BDK51DRAFT_44566 [Blyttiomyces helicus]|uniref:Uncharacterized protein n=1 Tax=Blyttiomyces helicus TaxID=388810 RepID=A0A4P9W538_9FUNG|nr:hypothetical protein BDK51DRAFT_44566 [Blyttiomyces helicus]|eukprot:RKO85226.1 hypothetical protein BDK51DRAFT_44566 [Blyttiomyces helicus]